MSSKSVTKLKACGTPGGTDLAKSSGSSPPSADDVANRIFYYIFVNFRPVSERQIQKTVRVRKALIVEALRKLVRRRLLKRIARGRRKEPYLYFVCSCSTCLRSYGKAKKGAPS